VNRPILNLKRATLFLALAVGGVVATTALSPSTRAAYATPSISAQYAFPSMHVTGSNFTPGGSVFVEVLDPNLNVVGTTTTTATAYGGCTRYVCAPGGNIDTTVLAPSVPLIRPVYVIAYDYGSGTESNWVKY
jgi:hypothetical protein